MWVEALFNVNDQLVSNLPYAGAGTWKALWPQAEIFQEDTVRQVWRVSVGWVGKNRDRVVGPWWGHREVEAEVLHASHVHEDVAVERNVVRHKVQAERCCCQILSK